MDIENKAESWFGNEDPYTAKERRILITQWTGEAWNILSTLKYDKLRRKCWMKPVCLITADGSEDHLINPEGLPEYQVPLQSLVEPVGSTAVSNLNEVPPRGIDVNESNKEINEIAENDEFFGPAEDNGERNLFDFIDNMIAE